MEPQPTAASMEALFAAVRPHWQKEPALLKGLNCVDFGVKDLYQLFVVAGQRRVEETAALIFKAQEQVSGYPSLFHAYLHGASVVINHVEASFPPLLEWCKELRQRWVPHAYLNMYLTPAGSRTVRPHSDDRDVVLLQCLGKKKWRVTEPLVPFPYSHEQVGKDRVLEESDLPKTLLECMLEEGDAFYIPRGFVHVGESTDDGPSMHLTLAIATHDWTYAKLLADIAFAASSRQIEGFSAGGSIADESIKASLGSEDDEKDVEGMLQEARERLQTISLEGCRTATDVAKAVQAKLDEQLHFKRAVPFSIYFANGSSKGQVLRTNGGSSSSTSSANKNGSSHPVVDRDQKADIDTSEAGVQRIVEAMGCWSSLREAYRERLEKHNRWHDELLKLWQAGASGSEAPAPHPGAGSAAVASSSSSASPSSASDALHGGSSSNNAAAAAGRRKRGQWSMPPRLDHDVRLAKGGRYRFSCRISEERATMEVKFEDESGRMLDLLTLPMYLEVLKYIEHSSGGFCAGDLPVPDPVGQLCFAAVGLHTGILEDV